METVGYLAGFIVLIVFACYGVLWEVRRYKAMIDKDKKQALLYEEVNSIMRRLYAIEERKYLAFVEIIATLEEERERET